MPNQSDYTYQITVMCITALAVMFVNVVVRIVVYKCPNYK